MYVAVLPRVPVMYRKSAQAHDLVWLQTNAAEAIDKLGAKKVALAYASSAGSNIYHLVVKNEMETLCGLKVSRLKSQQALHLVSEPSPRAICKHCQRIEQNAEGKQG
jgi:hypothetical protein